MENRRHRDANDRILEDILPDAVDLKDVMATWQFGRVRRQFTARRVSRGAKLVDDVWSRQESVRICEACTNVCARSEWSVYLQRLYLV